MSEERIIELGSESRCIQGQLEGLYRQLYQGCSQHQLIGGYPYYKAMADTAAELFGEISNLRTEFEKLDRLTRKGTETDTGLN